LLDCLITNGRVIDGTGNPWFYGDVGIKAGRIAMVQRRAASFSYAHDAGTCSVMDASGLFVAPGFVDLHSHSDRSILENPGAMSSLLQGVTTECTGMCGISPFPTQGAHGSSNLEDFRDQVSGNGTGINIAPLVGHGAVRTYVMGPEGEGGERYFPREDEMEAMQSCVRDAMEQGAFGISTGLIYAPGRNAAPMEIEALCRIVASYGGVHCCHLRSEEDMLIEAVDEMVRVALSTGVASSASHHKAMFRRNWGKPSETMRQLARAREDGLEVVCDFYPWVISATSNLTSRFAGALASVHKDEKPARIEKQVVLEALGNRATWDAVKRALNEQFAQEVRINDARAAALLPTGAIVRKARDLRYWECIAYSPSHPMFFALTFEDVALRLGTRDYWDGIRKLYLEDEGETRAGAGPMCEEDILTILASPCSVIGSDSSTSDRRTGAHPRNYGNFAYALVHFVREQKAISLDLLIKKMTSQPAAFVGITDRGSIREGNWADIVIFDWERLESRADFAHPQESPEGIQCVLVNGQIAVENGATTGVRAGKVIRARSSRD